MICDDPYGAVENAHAVAILTEWDQFKDLDYQKIFDKMMKPAFLFDGRSVTDRVDLRDIGFRVYSIGR